MRVRLSASTRAGLIAGAAASALLVGSFAAAQIPSALVRESDTVSAGVTVTGIDVPAANGVKGWAFLTSNSDALDRAFGNPTGGAGAIMRTEGTFGNFVQTAFEGFFGMGDSGSLTYGPTVNDTVTGATGLDSVWVDNTVGLNEGDPIPGMPGQFSTFNSDPNMTNNNTPYWVGGFGTSGTTQNRAMFKGVGASTVWVGGDLVPNVGLNLSTSTSPFGGRMSADASNYIVNHVFAGATTATDSFVLVNGNMFMAQGAGCREGTVVPVAAGGNGVETWVNFDATAINNAGQVFFTGNTNGAVATDEFVFLKDQIVLREGAAINTGLGPGVISGAIEWGDANESNDWAVTWDITVGGTNYEALIVNSECLLIETEKVDWNGDGMIDAADNNGRLADFTGIRSVAIGERQPLGGGDYFFDVFFTADIDFNGTTTTTDDLEGGFRLRVVVPEPASLSLLAFAGLGLRRPRRK